MKTYIEVTAVQTADQVERKVFIPIGTFFLVRLKEGDYSKKLGVKTEIRIMSVSESFVIKESYEEVKKMIEEAGK